MKHVSRIGTICVLRHWFVITMIILIKYFPDILESFPVNLVSILNTVTITTAISAYYNDLKKVRRMGSYTT